MSDYQALHEQIAENHGTTPEVIGYLRRRHYQQNNFPTEYEEVLAYLEKRLKQQIGAARQFRKALENGKTKNADEVKRTIINTEHSAAIRQAVINTLKRVGETGYRDIVREEE